MSTWRCEVNKVAEMPPYISLNYFLKVSGLHLIPSLFMSRINPCTDRTNSNSTPAERGRDCFCWGLVGENAETPPRPAAWPGPADTICVSAQNEVHACETTTRACFRPTRGVWPG